MPSRPRLSLLPYMLVLALTALWAGLCIWTLGLTEQGVLELTRLTARTSVFFFLAAFAASALFRTWPTPFSHYLLRNRRNMGLAFALAHFIHLGVLTSYFILSGEDPGLVRIIGGGLGYVIIGLMAMTSNDWSVRRLGRNWKRLHIAGGWYIWLIFLNGYLGRTLKGEQPVLIFGCIAALTVMAGLLKFAVWQRSRQTRPGV
ncbi:hypothetical protein ACQKH5_18030 [Hyphomonas sp. NPDC076900]|uniref:hypothetical protein n=1 Tax=unclassified Hyphomonas TaxID=2630699 RepID=UPI003CFC0CB0